MKSKKGFTLVEMMLVVAIIVVISAVGIIAIGDTIKRSKNQQEEYKQHIDSMGFAQGNVKNIMADTRNPNVPAGSAKPAEPKGDTGDKTPAGETKTEDKTEDKKVEEEEKTPAEDEKKDENAGFGLIGDGEKKEQEEPASGESVSGSAGLSVTNNWGNGGQGKVTIPSASGKQISKVTLVIDGAKFNNVWNFDNGGQYEGSKSSDSTQYTIKIKENVNGVPSLNDIMIQWENGNPPKNIEYIVEYK